MIRGGLPYASLELGHAGAAALVEVMEVQTHFESGVIVRNERVLVRLGGGELLHD